VSVEDLTFVDVAFLTLCAQVGIRPTRKWIISLWQGAILPLIPRPPARPCHLLVVLIPRGHPVLWGVSGAPLSSPYILHSYLSHVGLLRGLTPAHAPRALPASWPQRTSGRHQTCR